MVYEDCLGTTSDYERTINLIFVFKPLIQSLGTDWLRLRKSFCLLTSESDRLRKNFNNAAQMSLFDFI